MQDWDKKLALQKKYAEKAISFNPKTGDAYSVMSDVVWSERILSVLVGYEVYEVEAGGWQMRPHGIVHTYWYASDKPALFINIYFNQDFENILEEMF